jgi:hypothetical protein
MLVDLFKVLFLLISFIAIVHGHDKDLQCFVPGECVESFHLGSTVTTGKL